MSGAFNSAFSNAFDIGVLAYFRRTFLRFGTAIGKRQVIGE